VSDDDREAYDNDPDDPFFFLPQPEPNDDEPRPATPFHGTGGFDIPPEDKPDASKKPDPSYRTPIE
jgi:hypothetical protein